MAEAARRLTVTGRVQGVGFRPFVYRIAHRHGLTGHVLNAAGRVEIVAQGSPEALDAFAHDLIHAAPPLARPTLAEQREAPFEACDAFTIRASAEGTPDQAGIPPDQFACDDCVREMGDPNERRYGYPFTNCTQCGPRYTIIDQLPYDRPHTSMAGFPLCDACRKEYEDPLDRRFHAQPLACADCGPRLDGSIDDCVAALKGGKIVAIKGIGGYHLMCDAANPAPVGRLREKKPRPHKPLAVMVASLEAARSITAPEVVHEELLGDPMRPIVLVPKRPGAPLADAIAPGLDEVGLMLPYSPLHHLLLAAFDGALVATSGNVSGEPVMTDNQEIEARLGHVADAFLHHDRPIRRPADDPLFRVIAGRGRPFRLGRGVAPLELTLKTPLPHPVLAVGGEMKNAIALAWNDRAAVSPHIGELETPRGRDVFAAVIGNLQALYGVRAETVVHDLHPGYAATRWAKASGLPVIGVAHHHAHASALIGEGEDEEALVFTWDGVGLGPDGELWGGEALLGHPGNWRRFATFRPFSPPGGDRAAREPWRSAVALCWETGIDWPGAPESDPLLRQAWEKGVNAPATHAAGRLFDAAAALTGLLQTGSFEGQGPMVLEAAASSGGEPVILPLEQDTDGVWIADWAPLPPMLMDSTRPVTERAARFHASLAHTILAQAQRAGVGRVGLTGGAFQNRHLTEQARKLLEEAGFEVLLHRKVPCNDGGLAFGQLIEAAARMTTNG